MWCRMKAFKGALIAGILTSLTSTAHAYTQFETTCTVPSNASTNFVSSPDTRGTLDILWSCLFTIIACTWTIQHLNVPEQRKKDNKTGGAHGYWCDFKWTMKGFWRNLKWMLFTVVAPEYILGKAAGDYWVARRMVARMKEYAAEDKVEGTVTHGFYANMGGFVGVEESEDEPSQSAEHHTRDNIPVLPHSQEETSNIEKATVFNGTAGYTYSLAANHIHWLRAPEDPTKPELHITLPDITAAEIHDKSKGSFFVKAVAVAQVSWISVQVIVRAARGLSVSQLELAVTAFSACAIATYILLLSKPQAVQVPSRPIKCKPGAIESAYQDCDEMHLRLFFIPGFDGVTSGPQHSFSNDYIVSHEAWGLVMVLFGAIFGGVIFGGIHVAGWHLDFPTAMEQKFWRISTTLMTGLLPVIFFPTVLILVNSDPGLYLPPRVSNVINLFTAGDSFKFVQAWGLVLGTIYITARLFVLVEIFRTLLYLPLDAYTSTWASNIPHFS